MRILHTSDWHLGKRFFGHCLLEDQRYVLDQMLNLARDLNPDVAVVAGDVFAASPPTDESYRVFHETIDKLLDLGTTVLVLAGPHDDFRSVYLGSRWIRERGLYLFCDPTDVLSPMTFSGTRSKREVTFWCLPYPQNPGSTEARQHPALVGRNLIEKVVQRFNPSDINVLLAYAWAQGPGRRPELGPLIENGGQPIEQRFLEFFDYSALGGVHLPTTLTNRSARYCGSILAYEDLDSQVERSVSFIDVLDKKAAFVEEYPLRPKRKLRHLSGTREEVTAYLRADRTPDLLAVSLEDSDLTLEESWTLRQLNPRVVAVEVAPGPSRRGSQTHAYPLTESFLAFLADQGIERPEATVVTALQQLEAEL